MNNLWKISLSKFKFIHLKRSWVNTSNIPFSDKYLANSKEEMPNCNTTAISLNWQSVWIKKIWRPALCLGKPSQIFAFWFIHMNIGHVQAPSFELCWQIYRRAQCLQLKAAAFRSSYKKDSRRAVICLVLFKYYSTLNNICFYWQFTFFIFPCWMLRWETWAF